MNTYEQEQQTQNNITQHEGCKINLMFNFEKKAKKKKNEDGRRN